MNYIDIDQVADQVKHLLWSFNSIDISTNQIKIFILYLLRTLTGSSMSKIHKYTIIKNENCEWTFNGNPFTGEIILSRLPDSSIGISFYSIILDYKLYDMKRKRNEYLIEKVLSEIKDNYNISYTDIDQGLYPKTDEHYELYSIIILTIFQYLLTKIINKKKNIYLIDLYEDEYIRTIISNKRRTCFILHYDKIMTSENSSISSIIIEKIKRKEIDDYVNTDTIDISNSEVDTLELL